MKIKNIIEGDVIQFPGKRDSSPEQKKYKRIDLASSSERENIIRLLKRLTKDTIGEWLWVAGPDSSPASLRGMPRFVFQDNFWGTYISHPQGESETAEQQIEQRVRNLIRRIEKNGMNVVNFELEQMSLRDKDNPEKRSWEMKIYFDRQTPPLFVDSK